MTGVYATIRTMVRAGSRARHRTITWVRRLWAAHQALMEDNAAYRRQVNIGIGAFLGVVAMHPDLRLIATALVGIYVAAHERGGGLSPGADNWRREDW